MGTFLRSHVPKANLSAPDHCCTGQISEEGPCPPRARGTGRSFAGGTGPRWTHFLRDPEIRGSRRNVRADLGNRASRLHRWRRRNGTLLVRDNPGNWSYPLLHGGIRQRGPSGRGGGGGSDPDDPQSARRRRHAEQFLQGGHRRQRGRRSGRCRRAQVQTSDILAFSRSKGLYGGRQSGWLGDFAPRCLELDILWAAGLGQRISWSATDVSNGQADSLRSRLSRNGPELTSAIGKSAAHPAFRQLQHG